MLAKKVKIALLIAAAALVSACSTPCGTPGGLCAPIESVTSTPVASKPVRLPERALEKAPEPAAEVQTYAIAMPGAEMSGASAQANAAGKDGVNIALLLPLRSETLGRAADALRAGFMAAYERDKAGLTINLIETGDPAQDVLSAYASAQQQNDIVVGPLARSAVTAVAASPLVSKPTIALNHPEGRGEMQLPPQMIAIGLSIEDEARQAASWAAQEHPNARALVLSAGSSWQKRGANAFAAQWQRIGAPVKIVELSASGGYLSDPELVALRARLQSEPADVLFAALDVDQARQLKVALNAPPLGDLPLYGISSLNPGRALWQPGPELDGVRLLDLPWQLQRDHPAVMVYPQPEPRDEVRLSADLERLYALGIDAFRVAREIALRPGRRFRLDGVTGQLTVDFGQGPSYFERVEMPAVYTNGVPTPVTSAQ
ncbi:MAG TPA: penicillin-binding protein activator [Pseudoduganella sp.]